MNETVIVKKLGQQPYKSIWHKMRLMTQQRTAESLDEIWQLEHPAIFTQGQAGKPENILHSTNIPVIQSDRGGQVTYHGPGQLILYMLCDLQRKKLNTREFINITELSVIKLLKKYGIKSTSNAKAPGVYVDGAKICSLGLRVRKGRTYHGLSLNIAMDLEPFTYINPCGYSNLKVTQLCDLGGPNDLILVGNDLINVLTKELNYKEII